MMVIQRLLGSLLTLLPPLSHPRRIFIQLEPRVLYLLSHYLLGFNLLKICACRQLEPLPALFLLPLYHRQKPLPLRRLPPFRL
jgi:hypothetical protein